ncbi:MBL fold metallo-hydrolase [Pseudoxanthomonas sp. JBR18]|uniref:MBL fold metallo-hydrolase n=1 Tax=Pseudoxanthomonas sp. JBR18 TaxID=2969308 RepID=UPI0023063867|nr:MBL fold metallo-hydrolase [Pseudoxanthomonas sp. JBR18]WCE05884.1 MBL fold metallo-hydrolase [Pseudoxanthomonas sp. JBR18]
MDLRTESRVYTVGEASVTRITDRVLDTLRGPDIFPDWTHEAVRDHAQPMRPEHLGEDGERLLMSVHSWLVRVGGKTVLVDTGIGNGKSRPFNPIFHQLNTDYLRRLAHAGVTPEAVDMVLLTHLHVDHVGWNTINVDGAWVPTFPNARYVYAQAEEDFYASDEGASRRMVFDDSVLPLIEAGLVQRIGDGGGAVDAHFHFHPTPGHCVGHMSIGLASAGASALFGGDVMHHPLQLRHPAWNAVFCAEAEQARRSRAWALAYVADTRGLYFSSHFAGTSVVQAKGPDPAQWAFV